MSIPSNSRDGPCTGVFIRDYTGVLSGLRVLIYFRVRTEQAALSVEHSADCCAEQHLFVSGRVSDDFAVEESARERQRNARQLELPGKFENFSEKNSENKKNSD